MQMAPPFLLKKQEKERRKNIKKIRNMLIASPKSPQTEKRGGETHGDFEQGPLHSHNWDDRFMMKERD